MHASTNIVGIVGPDLSREAHVIASFGKTLDIPIEIKGSKD
jgi:hypothetical protein